MPRYWFARRRLDQPMNRRMAPVSWEGWAVGGGFTLSMLVGASAMLGLSYAGMPAIGIGLFVVLAFAGGATFITLAYRKGDRNHTVEDYRSGRVVNPS